MAHLSKKEKKEKGYSIGSWKSIRKGWGFFKSRTRFEVGKGRRIKFWQDEWCGDVPLKDSFPSLFSFAASKELWVNDGQVVESGPIFWNSCFLRHFQDWEVNNVEELLWKLYVLGRSIRDDDKMVWKTRKRRVALVKSYSTLKLEGEVSFPSKIVWGS